MKKVGNHNSISRILLLSLAVMLTFSAKSFSQEGDAAAGKALFNANCAACHKLDAKMTGPALRGVTERQSSEWLHSWIKDSQSMVKSGDAAAVKIFEEYNKAIMTPFPQLSNVDIDNILAYTSEPAPVVEKPVAGPGSQSGGNSDSGVSNAIILGALALVMGILVVMLFLVTSVLNKIARANGMEVLHKEPTMPIWKAYAKNQFLVLVTSILLLLSGAWVVYGFLMQVGVDQNYAPIQPIHYSHKIHAGDNGIDCKYCHSAARTSKNAGIPSLNVCMNCHKNISEFAGDPDSTYVEYSKEFYTAEIQKLYDAVGWDKDNQKYTGKTKPVKWVRIHNLPDFVYFNHSQHVSVAGLECQKCHGPVENYEVMKQFAPLTMGWCIDCHRETNVKTEGNEYYEKIHAELAKKYGKDKLTAAEMGGLECGKCHY
ncbi:cytochrome c3 family protein [Flavobacterium sp. SM2513]|uniref:cytochrome c3 family protein n=1 Tax=Flavobacterium sp. SM2513 TaxID=3424766 RepID=UPI003D7F30C5